MTLTVLCVVICFVGIAVSSIIMGCAWISVDCIVVGVIVFWAVDVTKKSLWYGVLIDVWAKAGITKAIKAITIKIRNDVGRLSLDLWCFL
jgi:hypothetical protein